MPDLLAGQLEQLLDEARLNAIADAVLEVVAFEDPVGEVVGMRNRPNGRSSTPVRVVPVQSLKCSSGATDVVYNG